MKRLADEIQRSPLETDLEREPSNGRRTPSKAQPFRAFVVDLLLKHPQLRSLEIVRRAKAAGYDGGKSALYSLIASVRPAPQPPVEPAGQGPGRDLSPRHGPGRRAVPRGRRGPVGELLRDAPRVLALDRGLDRRGPEHRDRWCARWCTTSTPSAASRCWRRSTARSRSGSARTRRAGHRMGLGVRLRGHPAGAGGRGAGAPRRRSRAGHQPRQLGQTLLLQIAHLRQRSRHGTPADDWLCDLNTRRDGAQRKDAGNPARRGAPAVAPAQI